MSTTKDTSPTPAGSVERSVQPFDKSYHASLNPAAKKYETARPCAICGWGPRMAIHGYGWEHVHHGYVSLNA